ncbi:PepSY-associated TM helix domain-containing protein [Gordonia sp. CPCC 205333]|uniref:PepSY-associated TM helix domain-containing protein n=1 Tax=Gordonia sp. CPCC 205333 TaxID=3140790 RepID=UPI003AF3EFC9
MLDHPTSVADPRLPAAPDDAASRATPGRTRKSPKRNRKPLRRILIVSHRWLSIVFGLVLVVECTTGAVLVYEPELLRASSPELYQSTATPTQVGFDGAIDAVRRADANFDTSYVSLKDGVYQLSTSSSDGETYFVDAGTGTVSGHANVYSGVVGFVENLHDCALSCEGYAGYQAWPGKPSPLATWAPTEGLTWGGLTLALTGLLAIFLAISGLIIWYPGLKKWRHGFRVRLGKGRYARDVDLHNVIGLIAVVPLLIWGLTGMNFEVPAVSKLWLATTGGQSTVDQPSTMETVDARAPRISIDDAMTAARATFTGSTVTWAQLPTPTQEYYSFYVLDGRPDLWKYSSNFHGNRLVGVDAHDAHHVEVFQGRPSTISNAVLSDWAQPALHYGFAVNPWWRIAWCVLGLTPLLLMLTGLSTWLFRRQVARRRQAARRSG